MATRKTKRAFQYDVEGLLEELKIGGTMSYWVVFLPASIAAEGPFSERRRLRMKGLANGTAVAMAWQLSGGRHYVMFGRALAKKLGIALGNKVTLAFDLVDDDEVEVPPEIREALRQEPAWRAGWKKLAAGKQRGLAHLVNGVKDPERRAQRAVDLLRDLERGVVPGPPRSKSLK